MCLSFLTRRSESNHLKNVLSRFFVDIGDHLRANESSIIILDHRHRIEMRHVRFDSSFIEKLLHFARRVFQGQCKMIIGLFTEFIDLLEIRFGTDAQNLSDLSI